MIVKELQSLDENLFYLPDVGLELVNIKRLVNRIEQTATILLCPF